MQELIETNVFLMGRPPLGEYLGFLTTQMVDGHLADRGLLAQEWREANDRVKQLERDEAGWADGATVDPISADLQELEARVLSDAMYRRQFELVPWCVGEVELDRLVVYQKRIGLGHIERVRATLGPNPSRADVFRLCLPYHHPPTPAVTTQQAPNGWVFTSPSNDLRLMDATLLRPDQISGYQAKGATSQVVALMVGFSPNLLHVLQIEGRLILMNGSHRAYALREAGFDRVPCLVLKVTRREELEVVGSEEVKAKPDEFLKAPRPPVLKDYFDPALRKLVPVRRLLHQVQVGFGVNQTATPLG
jgi:hypothetical protein